MLSKSTLAFIEDCGEEAIQRSTQYIAWAKRRKQGNTKGLLSKPQRTILLALLKSKKPMTRKDLLKTNIKQSNIAIALVTGINRPGVVKGSKSLKELKLIRQDLEDHNGKDVKTLRLTKKGIRAAKALIDS